MIAHALTSVKGDRLSLALRWLAGETESPKYDKLLALSVGLGIQPTVILHAQRLCHLHKEEIEIEGQLRGQSV